MKSLKNNYGKTNLLSYYLQNNVNLSLTAM